MPTSAHAVSMADFPEGRRGISPQEFPTSSGERADWLRQAGPKGEISPRVNCPSIQVAVFEALPVVASSVAGGFSGGCHR